MNEQAHLARLFRLAMTLTACSLGAMGLLIVIVTLVADYST